eukprot:gene51406-22958_t
MYEYAKTGAGPWDDYNTAVGQWIAGRGTAARETAAAAMRGLPDDGPG